MGLFWHNQVTVAKVDKNKRFPESFGFLRGKLIVAKPDYSQRFSLKPLEKNMLKQEIGTCELCGATIPLEIHHKDKRRFNNSLANLEILCQKCHRRLHRKVN
jgi:5-methylcytosine-specific restriction endonuclease McrA